jgi:uncharacterized protein (DUF1810 family)
VRVALTPARADDPFDLHRFVAAQDADGTYDQAVAELRAGRKRSHWMWFVFPQLTALGRSATARRYGIATLAEAQAYLAHPVLGPRLRECADVVAGLPAGPVAIFGDVDALKLRSSMTLFGSAGPDEPAFARVLDRHFAGEPDPATATLLSGRPDRRA